MVTTNAHLSKSYLTVLKSMPSPEPTPSPPTADTRAAPVNDIALVLCAVDVDAISRQPEDDLRKDIGSTAADNKCSFSVKHVVF